MFKANSKNKGRITPAKAYDRQMPKSEKLRGVGRRSVRSSYAHQEADFAKAHPGEREKYGEYGGDRCDPLAGSAPRLGQGALGRDVQHGKATSKENVKPPTAHSFASFEGVGGSPKKQTLG